MFTTWSLLNVLFSSTEGDTRILVREAVVVLTPDVRGDQEVHRGDRLAPRDLTDGGLQPLRVLVQHGVDHVHEGLVGAPDAVTAGEQVALDEAFIWCSESCSVTWPVTAMCSSVSSDR